MEEYKYIVCNEPINGTGDIWNDFFDTQEEANAEACSQWDRLTHWEQKRRRVFAGKVLRSYLPDWAVDEDDRIIDWMCYESIGCADDRCFDSAASQICVDGLWYTAEQLAEVASEIVDEWESIVPQLDLADDEEKLLSVDAVDRVEEIRRYMIDRRSSVHIVF